MQSTVRQHPAVSTFVAVVIAIASTSVTSYAQQDPAEAPEPELDEAQEQELMSLAQIVAAALQGQIVPTDEPFGWANDFLKSDQQTTFVPFTLSIEQSTVSTPTVAMYVFVAPPDAPAPDAPAPDAPVADADAAEPLPEPAFEDAYHVDLGAPTADGAYEIRRGFWVPAGDYDIYVALSESGVPDGTEAKTMMLKQVLSVPDLWSDQLATSSVIQAARIEPLAAPLAPDQVLANPYVMGLMRIVPKSTAEYGTSDELSLLFLIYNVGVTESGMPDVGVEYTFNTRGPGGDEYFNATTPQAFNNQTLPQNFDLLAGDQLVAGQAIPLSGFPPASYRLEIKITDNTNDASLVRNVDFSVAAP